MEMFGKIFSATTEGISVRVRSAFHPEYSDAEKFVFTYHIAIENKGSHTVQLLRRHWYIFDSDGSYQEVEGEGVIGQQPTLQPNQTHKYVSGCHLKTDMGKMWGKYLMKRLEDDALFEVIIPEFMMIDPLRLN